MAWPPADRIVLYVNNARADDEPADGNTHSLCPTESPYNTGQHISKVTPTQRNHATSPARTVSSAARAYAQA